MARTLPLYPRLTLAFVVALLAGMLVAWWIAVSLFSRALEDRAARSLRQAAATLAEGLPLTPELLGRLAALQRSEFVLLDAAFAPRLSTYAGGADGAPAAPPAIVAAARAAAGSPDAAVGAGALREFTAEVGGVRHLGVVTALSPGRADPRLQTLVAVASLADAERTVRRAGRALGLAMLGAVAVLALLLQWLVRGITGPLERLADMAHGIAGGDRQVRAGLARDDEIGRLAAALDEMSERLAAYERELAQKSRTAALGELAARIAHEIRNPLTGMKMQLQLLAERLSSGLAPGAAERERIARVIDELRRLELVVSATLAVGSDQPLQRAPADPAAVAREVVQLMQPALTHRHIQVEAVLPAAPEIALDRDRIKQVLLNLLTNAADALPGGGRIRVAVRAAPERGGVALVVEDSGPGIAADVRERLFEPAATTKPMGLGLGLALSRDLVRRHGGELRASSSADLGGAAFEILLPLRESA